MAGCAVLLLLNVFAWKDAWRVASPHYLTVEVLDIGQGDSIFIETPSLRHIIVDGGPGSAVMGKLSQRLPLWDRHLDMVVLTHPDADHLNGLLQVLQKYQVDYIVWTGITREGQGYQEWVRLIEQQKQHGANVVIVKQGDQIKNGQVTIDVLHPFEPLEGQFFDQGNDTGVVVKVIYGQKSFLLTADISSNVEQQLIDDATDLTANVLKVAHHGSKYSSSAEFLQAVHPRLAAISVGATNTYGHPTPEVLQRLADSGITTIRTDQHGDITMVSDGNHINIQ